MNELFLILSAAILPAAILLVYIFAKDKLRREPVKEVGKGVLFGVGSVLCTFLFIWLFSLAGLAPDASDNSFMGRIRYSFFGAAIPEESAKLLMLWLLLRRCRYFDEHMDGIVYAVAVGMGFAAVENIVYLFNNYNHWMSVGITRALFSVPGHFAFAVFMGYYYSLFRFGQKSWRSSHLLAAWGVPVMLHGIFDALLFLMDFNPALTGLLFVAFLAFCFGMHAYARKRIKEHLETDRKQMAS